MVTHSLRGGEVIGAHHQPNLSDVEWFLISKPFFSSLRFRSQKLTRNQPHKTENQCTFDFCLFSMGSWGSGQLPCLTGGKPTPQNLPLSVLGTMFGTVYLMLWTKNVCDWGSLFLRQMQEPKVVQTIRNMGTTTVGARAAASTVKTKTQTLIFHHCRKSPCENPIPSGQMITWTLLHNLIICHHALP